MADNGRPDKDPLTRAYQRVDIPFRIAREADRRRVQWALDRATRALERLSLECTIAAAHTTEADARHTAETQRRLSASLSKLRGSKA